MPICQFGIFIRNGLLHFPDFLHDGGLFEYLKTDRPFLQKKSFLPKFGKKCKWPQNMFFFLDFLKNFVFRLSWK